MGGLSSTHWRVLLAGVLLTCSVGTLASALEARLTLSQLKHSRWTVEDGAPPTIVDLAQGRDGFLWVGGTDGLYRFDGVSFEKMPSTEADEQGLRVSSLLSAKDGTLWVGYSTGLLAIYRGGALHDASTLAPAPILRLLQTRDGTIWALIGGSNLPLLRYAHGQWRQVTTELGLPSGQAIDARATRDGSLWITTLHAAMRLSAGGKRFTRVAAVSGHAAVSEDPLGSIWVSDDRGSRVVAAANGLSDRVAFAPTPHARRAFHTLFDRDGNLWGANGAGIFRVRSAADESGHRQSALSAQVEQFTSADGLTSKYTHKLIEDREGNIWVGTSRGLDMFRNPGVVIEPSLTNVPTYGFALLGAADGTVYVGAADALYRIKPYENPAPLINVPETQALCEGPDGTIWAFLRDRAFQFRGDAAIRIPMPPTADAGIENCTFDDHNLLWVNGQSAGLFSLTSGAWRRAPADPRYTADQMTSDRRRHLMVLTQRAGDLTRADPEAGRYQSLARIPGLVSSITQADSGFYVGGSLGLTRLGDGHPQTLPVRRFPWLRDVEGLVDTPAGQTWMSGKAGIVGVETAALRQAFSDPISPLQPVILDYADGLPDIIPVGTGTTAAARGGDGRLWFSTAGGVVWIDPSRLPHNNVAPPVAIRALIAQNVRYEDPTRLALPAGASKVSIQYSALSFVAPQRVRFRYRLEGVDKDWVDPGRRREAFYTNLQPGDYRFRVIAANNDGVWNRDGAVVAFSIAPTFVQSIWFKILIALAFAGLAWLAVTLLVRQEAARLQGRFDVRIAERERIARELHDTLLQGFQGLLLRFQAIANRLPGGSELRNSAEDALNRADVTLAEGRARVRELRSGEELGDLAGSLAVAASTLIDGDTPIFHLTVEGAPEGLNPLFGEEVVRIFEEAVRNVVQHANAQRIDALLAYGRRQFRLSVRDDGMGMPDSILTAGSPAGHFGLMGMRERAERAGGKLEVTSREGGGTQVVLLAPARSAYARRRRLLPGPQAGKG